MDHSIEEQLRIKNDELAQITQLVPEPPALGPPWHFRDKIKLTVGGTTGHPTLGILEANLEHVIEIPGCPIQATALNRTLPLLKQFIIKWRLTPYQVTTRSGELKGVILSWSPTTQEKMVRFVLRSKEALDRIRQGLDELSEFQVVSVNLQPIPHALLEGEEEIILSEKKYLRHDSQGVELHFSPQSFMQTNSAVAGHLYATAGEWLAPWKHQRVLDLFCGVGGFSLHLARQGHEVHGVEINSSAILAAQRAASEQGLKAQFSAAPAEAIAELWSEWSPSIVIANPPRRGLGNSLPLLKRFLPPLFLYSSCSKESLEKDLMELTTSYVASRTKLFDMFPNTLHFESLTLLVRR